MSDEPRAIAVAHDEAGHANHPTQGVYVMIGVILFILTVIEVAVIYVEVLHSVTGLLQAILLVLMTVKFALVALFFMHLKFDNRLFAGLFTVPLLASVAIVIALVALMSYWFAVGPEVVVQAVPASKGH